MIKLGGLLLLAAAEAAAAAQPLLLARRVTANKQLRTTLSLVPAMAPQHTAVSAPAPISQRTDGRVRYVI